MKKLISLLALSWLVAPSLARAGDQPVPYTEGDVVVVDFIKVKPGMMDDYLRSLETTLKPAYDEAIRQKLVLSYRILHGAHANPSDWDLLIEVEYRNMAALDGVDEKFRAIETKLVGDQATQHAISTKRLDVREIYGSKITRQLILK
jgi:hypothetical protein